MDDAQGRAAVLELVGGLLLGAAIASVILFLAPTGIAQPGAALVVAFAAVFSARLLEARRGIGAMEAVVALGLVAAGSLPFYPVSPPIFSAFAAALIVVATLMRGGRSPLVLVAPAAFYVTARHATGAAMLRGVDVLAECAFVLALIAFGALLARARHERWAGYALALQGVALAVATLPLLDAFGVTDPGVAALGTGATLGALLALGLRLRARQLVATSGALLALAAAAFAFLALGPALAAVTLLCMGAALVWQADAVRGYLTHRSSAP